MGAVYRALDEGKGATVALKVLHGESAIMRQLFEREYQTLAKLQHPRVIQVFDYGLCADGGCYYTMELLGGADMASAAPISWSRLCEHLRDVCTSLSLLHTQQLVHRDINPRNVRLDQHGRAKLIDFGALTPFGRASEVVGTASCMAPEVLRGGALDGRTDLFSLGVVAYWTLTKRLPFAIGQLSEAENAWQTSPEPPSRYAQDVPEALDALILSLLSIDPLARPASAADVLDRLGAIAGLDDAPLAAMAESHIASATLVGRDVDQVALEQLVERARSGRGSCVTIRGGAGAGKTRLLSELSIHARLSGLSVLAINGSEQQDAQALLISLVRGLLEVAPQETHASLALSSPDLTKLLINVGIVRAQLERPSLPLQEDALEETVRTQHAVSELLLEVARARSLLITIDDAQRVHSSVAGVLTMLAAQASRAPILLACAVDAAEHAPPAVQQLAFMGTTVELTPLNQASVEQLVHAMFGAVPYRARLAQWLNEHAHGNPGKLLDLLRELIARRVLHYAGGAWALPSDLSDTLLREDTRELTHARFARLTPAARRLAELLALQNGALTDSACAVLLASHGPEQARSVGLELLQERLSVRDGPGYRIAQETARTLLLDGLSDERRRDLHQELGSMLRAANPEAAEALAHRRSSALTVAQVVAGIAIGLHLLRGRESELGTRLLRQGAIELTFRGESLAAATADLEAGVVTLRALGRPRHIYTTLMVPLSLAGTYTDWRLSYRYGDDTLDALRDSSGLTLAHKLAPYLGGRIALYLGLTLGILRFVLVPRSRITNTVRELLLAVIAIGSAVLGVCTVLQDKERALRVGQKLSPLVYFPDTHPLRMVHEMQRSLLDHAQGFYAEARTKSLKALAFVRSPKAIELVPETGRAQLEGGLLIVLGQLDALRCDGSALGTMQALEKLTMSTTRQTLASSRVAYHGHRGERVPFVRALEEMDKLAVEAGSIWRNDVSVPRMLWSTHAVCEDVLSLKRAVQQLESLASSISTVAQLRDVTDACYLSERGMATQALERHEPMLQKLAEEGGLRATQCAMAYARILRKAGQPARAQEVCEQALAKLSPEEREFTVLVSGVRRELAQALAAQGNLQRATELADALLQEQSAHDNPLLHGLAHGSRAEIALLEGDWMRLESELHAMREWFDKCEHPALYAQCQRLAERAKASRIASIAPPVSNDSVPFETEIA